MVTISLVVINTVLFFIIPDEIVARLCFLPLRDLDLLHIMTTTGTCTFVHLDFAHLFGNMIFLWVFGAVLETKIGRGRFLITYLLCSVISSLIGLNLLIGQVAVNDAPRLILQYHPVGASAAISGLLGLFAVCGHYARPAFTLPILFNPLFSFPMRIGSILLIGLFFAKDLAGSVLQMHYDDALVGYWGNVGGYIAGLMLALAFNHQDVGKTETQEVWANKLPS